MTSLEDWKNTNSNERKGKLAKVLIGNKNIHLVIYNEKFYKMKNKTKYDIFNNIQDVFIKVTLQFVLLFRNELLKSLNFLQMFLWQDMK